MLSNETIAENMLSDIEAYKEYIKELIVSKLNVSPEDSIYWDAWFRGAEGKDLENSEKGIIFREK